MKMTQLKSRSENKTKFIATKATKKKIKVEALFLLPSLVGVVIFYILPFIVIIYYSLVTNPIQRDFVFLDNYKKLISNTAFRLAVKNTVLFSTKSVPLAVFVSLVLALLLDCNLPWKSKFRTFFLSPMVVPVASTVLIWQVLFHSSGPLQFFGGHVEWLKSDYAQLVIVLLFLWKNLGWNMILFMAALSNIPRTLIEVAALEPAGFWFTLTQIKLKYISPTILFVTLLSLINSFKVFREVQLLAGDYPYESLYMLQHFMNNSFYSLDYQKLATAAVLMALAMLVIISLLFFFENRFGKDVEE